MRLYYPISQVVSSCSGSHSLRLVLVLCKSRRRCGLAPPAWSSGQFQGYRLVKYLHKASSWQNIISGGGKTLQWAGLMLERLLTRKTWTRGWKASEKVEKAKGGRGLACTRLQNKQSFLNDSQWTVDLLLAMTLRTPLWELFHLFTLSLILQIFLEYPDTQPFFVICRHDSWTSNLYL